MSDTFTKQSENIGAVGHVHVSLRQTGLAPRAAQHNLKCEELLSTFTPLLKSDKEFKIAHSIK